MKKDPVFSLLDTLAAALQKLANGDAASLQTLLQQAEKLHVHTKDSFITPVERIHILGVSHAMTTLGYLLAASPATLSVSNMAQGAVAELCALVGLLSGFRGDKDLDVRALRLKRRIILSPPAEPSLLPLLLGCLRCTDELLCFIACSF